VKVLGALFSLMELAIYTSDFSNISNKWYGLLAFEVPVLIGRFTYLLLALFRFFAKKHSAPSTIKKFLIVNLKILGIFIIIEIAAGADMLAAERLRAFVSGVLAAAIWIPYLQQSRRVKATFIN
jgi:hypothetical protein